MDSSWAPGSRLQVARSRGLLEDILQHGLNENRGCESAHVPSRPGLESFHFAFPARPCRAFACRRLAVIVPLFRLSWSRVTDSILKPAAWSLKSASLC